MIQEKMSTKVNPGAFQQRQKITLRRLGGQLLRRLRQGKWREAWHYTLSEGLNMLYEYKILGSSGVRYHCPVCGYKGSFFVSKSNELRIAWHSVCPACNSRSRHRGLKFLYEEMLTNQPAAHILHFAPEPILTKVIKQFDQVIYQTTDFLLEDVDFPGEDIQSLHFQDASFDLVLCNHVIEHVPDDRQALMEIARILKPGGKAVITIPGVWKRQETVYFKDLRHNGHYRDYGMEVVHLFQSVFSHVEVKNLHDYQQSPSKGFVHGIPAMEPAFVCSK